MDKSKVALITIDVQEGFHDPFWGNRNNPAAEVNIEFLLNHWRGKRWPVFHVQHASRSVRSPLNPEKPGFKFMDFVRPQSAEPIFTKNVNSAFIETDLEQALRKAGIERLVFCGFVTDHCVSTTCRMAANLGFECTVVSDATATFDRVGLNGEIIPASLVHEINLASLNQEFAEIISARNLEVLQGFTNKSELE